MNFKYLNEAVDFSTAQGFLDAMEKGAAGVSKDFLSDTYGGEIAKEQIESLLNKLKYKLTSIVRARPQDINHLIIFVLEKFKGKKIGEVSLLLDDRRLNPFFDTLFAYYKNKDKQKFKTEQEGIDLLKEFRAMKYPFTGDLLDRFENYCNDKFSDKIVENPNDESINKEADILYNKGGWLVVVPKTPAAARKYACMGSRRAKWCTASKKEKFENYTKKDNKLYIIRNEKLDKMFQMDWGEHGGFVSFQNESNSPASIPEFMDLNPPKDMLALIKSKGGASLEKLFDAEEGAGKEEKLLGGWNKKTYSLVQLSKEFPSFEKKIDDLVIMIKQGNKTKNAEVFTREDKTLIKIDNEFYKSSSANRALSFDELKEYIGDNTEAKKAVLTNADDEYIKGEIKEEEVYKSDALQIIKYTGKVSIASMFNRNNSLSLKKEFLKKESNPDNAMYSLINKSTSAYKIISKTDVGQTIGIDILFLPSRKFYSYSNLLNISIKNLKDSVDSGYRDILGRMKQVKNFYSKKDKEKLMELLPEIKTRINRDVIEAKFSKPILVGKNVTVYEKDPRSVARLKTTPKDNEEREYIFIHKHKQYIFNWIDLLHKKSDGTILNLSPEVSIDVKKEFNMENIIKLAETLMDKGSISSTYSKEYLDSHYDNELKYRKNALGITKKTLNNVKRV